jgi:DNA invertase Pin-like site-specific DNA recombinase
MGKIGNFVAYYRVSTQQQGRSGLGLDAQRDAVARYLSSVGGAVLSEFQEVETGKGANALAKRPQLQAALADCRIKGATLIIAKLDRLARNVHFVSGLMEAGCEFVAADMPQANKTMIHMHAVMAEWERDQISERTKAALRAAKARGVRLGVKGSDNIALCNVVRELDAKDFAEGLREQMQMYRGAGYSQRRIADALNRLGVPSRDGRRWSQKQVQRVLIRLDSNQ